MADPIQCSEQSVSRTVAVFVCFAFDCRHRIGERKKKQEGTTTTSTHTEINKNTSHTLIIIGVLYHFMYAPVRKNFFHRYIIVSVRATCTYMHGMRARARDRATAHEQFGVC